MKLLFFTLFFVVSTHADEFTRFDEYLKNNQGQSIIHKEFSKLVQENSIPLKIKQKKPIKISVIYPGNQVSDYWKRSLTSFTKRLDELKVDYKVEQFFSKNSEVRSQAKQIISSLKGKPDYLIFTLDAKIHKKIISQILSKNKTKLILQNITTPLKIWRDNQPFLYVGFDHEKGSQLLTKKLMKKFPRGANYSMLYYTNGYVSQMRGDSVVRELSKHSSWKNVGRYYTDGNKEKTKNALKDLVKRKTNVDVLFTCATDIAIAAAKFEKDNNLKFYINGWGGGSAELESITGSQKHGIDYTVMRINDDNGIAMAEAIKLDLQNEKHLVPQIFSGEMVIVDKNTTKFELDELKRRSFRYSGK